MLHYVYKLLAKLIQYTQLLLTLIELVMLINVRMLINTTET